MNSLIEVLNWRYATKKMDPNRVVPQEKIDRILEAIRLAPTSSGLQQFHVFVITDKELQRKITPHAKNQAQVEDCSHLLVFAAWDSYTADRINEVYDKIHELRGHVRPQLKMYSDKLITRLSSKTPEMQVEHASHQAHLAMGIALVAAAMEEVDSVPIGGFDPPEVDALLDLHSKGLRSVLLLPLGYRDTEGDWLVNQPKFRKQLSEVVTEIK